MDKNKEELLEHPKPLVHYIREGLRQLQQNDLLCDTTIVAGGKRFPCHRMLLAAINPYFRAMFSSSFRESQDGEVVLEDIDPSIVETVLNYYYTEEVMLHPDTVKDLFVAASRLQTLPLFESCSRFLLKNLKVGNCLSLYELGYAHNDRKLYEEAKALVDVHFRRLCQEDPTFLNLAPSTIISIISLDSLLISSELVVYQAVWHWVMAQVSTRLIYLPHLLGYVRFPLLTKEELQKVQTDLVQYRELRPRWRRLNRQERLQLSHGLRRGMYIPCIVCVDLFYMEGPELKTKDFQIGCFNPQTETWEKLPHLKSLYCARCVAVDGLLYVSGGVHIDDTYSNTLHEFNPLRGRWTQLPSMSVARASHGFLTCNHKLYAMGGWSKSEIYLDSAECFDLVGKVWTPLAKMPFGVSHFASTVLNDKLYLVGGVVDSLNSWTASRKVLIYNVSNDTWTQVLLNNDCYWSGAVSMNNGIYVIGGYIRSRVHHHNERWNDLGNAHCSRKCFFVREDGKVDKSVSIPKLPLELAGAGVVRWKHRIYVLGGENTYLYNNPEGEEEEEYYNTVFYWEPGATKWIQCQERLPFTSWGLSGFGCTTMRMPKKPILELFRKTSVALTSIHLLKA